MVISKHSTTMSVALPKLSGDIILDVFTHKSIKASSSTVNEYDNERLAVLGEAVLGMAATFVLFHQNPTCTASDIRVRVWLL